MIKHADFNTECDFFSAERIEEIIVLKLKENLMFLAADLSSRDMVMDYLDRVSEDGSIKVVVMVSSLEKKGSEEYFDFYRKVLTVKSDRKDVHRLHNVFTQFILRIVDLNKIVVHASKGKVISLFLSLGLACDYRIVTDKTVFQNPFLKLGLIPIGGVAFFLSRRLRRSKALDILLSDQELTAHEAMRLGIVDQVVAADKLEEAALDAARRFAQKPAASLAGVKKLINFALKDFKDYLELENQELIKIIGSLSIDVKP
ncbi:MAG: enoyl-CoA hydratase/isomerase family protein [Pseudomonadota bacterium]|uniref:Enoyl-CoA hydratase/isomerase family protein n=1 Tax=Candidatus Desulfatibia profunda TaxID=2841695 RepID=A0A8J6TMY8_9BACT|nr:enoyl-CoA hydratase/isomerase family protein [Candidatus Desulfatibia profunda]MBL7180226.1 enoyl-CoA hydratase/isomerase family protein [Desulfobacterales bacterium]